MDVAVRKMCADDDAIRFQRYGSPFFFRGDFKDLPRLVERLRDGNDNLSKYLRQKLTANTKRLLSQCRGEPLQEEAEKALTDELNDLLKGDCLYTKERFNHVTLTAETKKLAEEYPVGENPMRVNRFLLEEAYPDEIGMVKRYGSKKNPWLPRLLYDLRHILDEKTTRPYRYIAAIFNLFNFHPENFCGRCKKFDIEEKICSRQRIFTCPRHTRARDKIYRMLKELSPEIPSARYPR
jgi:hypothetical protein